MAIHEYPYTDYHELNLDWIIRELKEVVDHWEEFASEYEGITATAQTVPYATGANVTVTGGSEGQPFNFAFDIPAGKDLRLVSSIYKYGVSTDTVTPPGTWYDSVPVIPQGYYLWTRVTLNFNDGTQSTFYSMARNGLDGAGSVITVNNISPDAQGNVDLTLPQPSDNTPLMDTLLGSEGVSNDYSRADHQHQSDTSKLDVQSGNAVGDLNAYVVEDISTQTIVPVSAAADPDSIAMYTHDGSLVVAEPQSVYEAPRLLDVQNGFVSNTTIQNYVQYTDIATASDLGIVQPDGTTITVDSDGIISSVPNGLILNELWSNATPTASFSGQTISIDLSSYQEVLILFRLSTSAAYNYSPLFNLRKGTDQDTKCILLIGSGPNIGVRYCKWGDSGVSFGNAQRITTSTVDDNSYMIPTKIYGIK